MRKTEHAGAKNGGGFWGSREEAKAESRRARRQLYRGIRKPLAPPSRVVPDKRVKQHFGLDDGW